MPTCVGMTWEKPSHLDLDAHLPGHDEGRVLTKHNKNNKDYPL
jgi:hypothetical protein